MSTSKWPQSTNTPDPQPLFHAIQGITNYHATDWDERAVQPLERLQSVVQDSSDPNSGISEAVDVLHNVDHLKRCGGHSSIKWLGCSTNGKTASRSLH